MAGLCVPPTTATEPSKAEYARLGPVGSSNQEKVLIPREHRLGEHLRDLCPEHARTYGSAQTLSVHTAIAQREHPIPKLRPPPDAQRRNTDNYAVYYHQREVRGRILVQIRAWLHDAHAAVALTTHPHIVGLVQTIAVKTMLRRK